VEIGRITSYAFHNTAWAYDLWKQMAESDIPGFVELKSIHKDDLREVIAAARKWQTENKLEPSAVFPPEMIAQFVDETVSEFAEWIGAL
jgi:hypothetical protein